ncbi:MAG: helix-turn-helix domain-containing protein [Shinella sp.]|uniref:helix-turn-helix domain-containing protein n=1 Tax=Shinella sp. TaxID=1870904 RepID=UPI004037482F
MAASFGDAGKQGNGGNIRVRDFIHHEGITLDSPDDQLSPDDTLMKGAFLHRELRRGLVLHVSDAMEQRAFTATSMLPEELSCIFFLEGNVDLAIGDRRFAFQADHGVARGATIMNASPESFTRISRGPQRLRHLVISATPEWLYRDALEAIADTKGGARLLRNHLAEHRWTLTPNMMELVRQIFAPSPLIPELLDLYLEGRAVELVAETMATVLQSDRSDAGGKQFKRRDAVCLGRAKDYIEAHVTEPLSVDTIAREAGISASGLQRLFRISENRSVFDYVRNIRLERAFVALGRGDVSIQEASVIAGYTSASNFATAFRRRFGIIPTAARE